MGGLTMSEATEASVRAEVRAWLETNFDQGLGLVEWRNKLIDSGWGVPSWPKDWYGRELPPALEMVVEEEMQRIGAVGVARTGIRRLAAATLLVHGSDEQKRRFLRRSLTGEDTWCQLFSEPGSASDLAGAMTRAEFKGNRWVINGQKVWTTSAHHADWGLLLARTDWDKPKHQGLSYFVLDIHQPGVEVLPLRQMNGYASFNQVFFTDAEVPPEQLVNEVGNGWATATTTLMHERRGADGIGRWGQSSDRAGRVDVVVERAKATGRASDTVVRQEIAKLLTMSKAAEWTALRACAAQMQGRPQGPEGSLGKLVSSN